MSAFSFVQSRSTNNAASLAYTSNVTSGNLLVVGFGEFAGSFPTSITDTLSNTWRLMGHYTFSSTVLQIWFAISGASGANTVTINNGSGTGEGLIIAEYVVPTTYSICAGPPSNVGTGTTISTGVGIETQTDSLVIVMYGDQHTNHTVSSANLNVRETQSLAGPGVVFALGDTTASTGIPLGTQYSFTWTGATNNAGTLIALALNDASSAGGTIIISKTINHFVTSEDQF